MKIHGFGAENPRVMEAIFFFFSLVSLSVLALCIGTEVGVFYISWFGELYPFHIGLIVPSAPSVQWPTELVLNGCSQICLIVEGSRCLSNDCFTHLYFRVHA